VYAKLAGRLDSRPVSNVANTSACFVWICGRRFPGWELLVSGAEEVLVSADFRVQSRCLAGRTLAARMCHAIGAGLIGTPLLLAKLSPTDEKKAEEKSVAVKLAGGQPADASSQRTAAAAPLGRPSDLDGGGYLLLIAHHMNSRKRRPFCSARSTVLRQNSRVDTGVLQ
jgi:hypothetical protein